MPTGTIGTDTSSAALEARRQAARALVERSFLAFCEWVTIQGERGPTPFRLYDYQEEMARDYEEAFWSDHREGFIELKSRQLGFSWQMAAFAYWCAAFHEAADVGYWSLDERAMLHHFRRRLHYIHNRLPDWLRPRADLKASEITFQGGSMIKGFPATKLAGESFTFRVVLMDEISKHEYGEQNWGAVSPTLQENGMYVLFSTAHPELGPQGFMYDEYFKAKRGEIPDMTARFTPWWLRPPRYVLSKDSEKLPDWDWYEKEIKRIGGTPEAVAAYYPDTDTGAFLGRSGLVFPKAPVGRVTCSWEDYKWRVAGVDFGGGDPTAITPIGITANQYFEQPGEFYRRVPASADEMYAYLSRLHDLAPFEFIMCDKNASMIATLQGMGLPAYAHTLGRAEGIDIMRTLHDEGRIRIDPRCRESIHEYDGYRWSERRDARAKISYMTSTPFDHHGDAMDARRYAVVHAWKALPQIDMETPVREQRRGTVFV